MKTMGYIESFISLEDATTFFENKVTEGVRQGWDIDSAEIRFVNYAWRIGIQFTRDDYEETEDTEDTFDGEETSLWEGFSVKSIQDS